MSKREIVKATLWLLLALVAFGILIPVEINFFQSGGATDIILGIVLIVFSLCLVAIMLLPFLKLRNRKKNSNEKL